MAEARNRRILLAARPVGAIKESDFKYDEVPIPEPGENEVLVRNLYLSLDPAMRGWMSEGESYIDPVRLGDVMRGLTIGEVATSKHPDFASGDKVMTMSGWQDYGLAGPRELPNKLPSDLPLPLSNFLSILGITGLTAYFGLLEVGQPKAGDTVVVSTAAGAVGSLVGQIAKLKGCRAVGITGSDEKCAWITGELGFDAAINYKTQDVPAELGKACPKGIDVYFDNVGGDILDAALARINQGARIAICGAITQYNATERSPGPANYLNLLIKSARMEGFIVTIFQDRFPEGVMQMAQWAMAGQLKHREDIIDGLENAPRAIQKLFDGTNTGKLMVKIVEA